MEEEARSEALAMFLSNLHAKGTIKRRKRAPESSDLPAKDLEYLFLQRPRDQTSSEEKVISFGSSVCDSEDSSNFVTVRKPQLLRIKPRVGDLFVEESFIPDEFQAVKLAFEALVAPAAFLLPFKFDFDYFEHRFDLCQGISSCFELKRHERAQHVQEMNQIALYAVQNPQLVLKLEDAFECKSSALCSSEKALFKLRIMRDYLEVLDHPDLLLFDSRKDYDWVKSKRIEQMIKFESELSHDVVKRPYKSKKKQIKSSSSFLCCVSSSAIPVEEPLKPTNSMNWNEEDEKMLVWDLMLLGQVLIQSDNPSRNLSIPRFISGQHNDATYSFDHTRPSLVWSKDSQVCAEAFIKYYGASFHALHLLIIEFLLHDLGTSTAYWHLLSYCIESILLNQLPMTNWESKLWNEQKTKVRQWTKDCILSYQHSFRGVFSSSEESVQSLSGCLQVYKKLVSGEEEFIKDLENTVYGSCNDHYSLILASVREEHKKNLETQETVEARVKCPKEMVYLLATLAAEFQKDVNAFKVSASNCPLVSKFLKLLSDSYLSIVVTEIQILLRLWWEKLVGVAEDEKRRLTSPSPRSRFGFSWLLEEVPEKVRRQPLDPHIFAILDNFKSVFESFSEFLDGDIPDIHPQVWFEPFVNSWILYQKDEFLDSGRIERAIDQDDWKPSASLCSSSLLDIFRFIHRVAERFLSLPYSKDQALAFAQLVSDIIEKYIQAISDLCFFDLDLEDKRLMWGIRRVPVRPNTSETELIVALPNELITRLNNIQLCRQQLIQLLSFVDLEKAYSNVSILSSSKLEDLTQAEDLNDYVEESTEIPPGLNCEATFKTITRILHTIERRFAEGMSKFWKKSFRKFIQTNPNEILKEDTMEMMLLPVMNDLAAKIELFIQSIFGEISRPVNSVSRIFQACLEIISEDIELLLIPVKTRYVLGPEGLKRASSCLNQFIDVLTEYEFNQQLCLAVHAVTRVTAQIDILQKPTHLLIEFVEELGQDMADPSEEYRKKTPPFMSKVVLSKAIKYRSKYMGDAEAAAFVKKGEKSLISRLLK